MTVINLGEMRNRKKVRKELKGDNDFFDQSLRDTKYFKPLDMNELIEIVSKNKYDWCVKIKSINFLLNWDEILFNLVIPNKAMYNKYLELCDGLVGLTSESEYRKALKIYSKFIKISDITKPVTPKKMNWIKKKYLTFNIKRKLKKYNFNNLALNQKVNGGYLPQILMNFFKSNSNYIMSYIDRLFWSDDYTELDTEYENSLKLVHDSCLIYLNTNDEDWLHLGFLHWCRLIRANIMKL